MSIRLYIFYLIFFYIRRAISTQSNPKSGLIEKKIAIYIKTYHELTFFISLALSSELAKSDILNFFPTV